MADEKDMGSESDDGLDFKIPDFNNQDYPNMPLNPEEFMMPGDGDGMEWDVLADVPDDQMAEFNKLLNNLSSLIESGEVPALAPEDSDLDEQIRKLMDIDNQAQQDSEDKLRRINDELSGDYLSSSSEDPELDEIDQLIAKLEARQAEAEAAPQKVGAFDKFNEQLEKLAQKNKILAGLFGAGSKLSKPILYGITGVLIVSILGLVFLCAFTFSRLLNISHVPEGGQLVQGTQGMGNDNNYIQTNIEKELSHQKLILRRLTTDQLATLFFFETSMDLTDVVFSLTDDMGNSYERDYAFYDGSNDIVFADRNLIRFEGLDPKTGFITLTATDQNESVDFVVAFTKLNMPPVRFSENPVNLLSEDSPWYIRLSSAEFSSAGTVLNLAFGSDRLGHQVLLASDYSITVRENGRRLLNYGPMRLFDNAAGQSLARLDLTPLRGLDSKLDFTFQDLYFQAPVNETITVSDLYYTNKPTEQSINMGDYNLVLERTGISGPYMILVARGEENFIEDSDTEKSDTGKEDDATRAADTTKEDKTPNRVKINIQANMLVTDENGDTIVIEGVSNSNSRGCDVTFDMTEIQNKSDFMNYQIDINSVQFMLPEITARLDVSKLSSNVNLHYNLAQMDIVTAFESRLEYMMGIITRDKIISFSPSVLAHTYESYLPVNFSEAPTVIVKPISIDVGENELYGAVLEYVTGQVDGKPFSFKRVHQIRAEENNDNWLITEDVWQ